METAPSPRDGVQRRLPIGDRRVDPPLARLRACGVPRWGHDRVEEPGTVANGEVSCFCTKSCVNVRVHHAKQIVFLLR